MSDKYAAITAHWGQYPVQRMCRALEVSLSGYYEAKARLAQGPSVRARADERLLVHVRAAFTKSHGRYGVPRILRALRGRAYRRTSCARRTRGTRIRLPRIGWRGGSRSRIIPCRIVRGWAI